MLFVLFIYQTMKEGPFGMTSKPNIFLATYRLLLSATYSYGYLTEIPVSNTNFVILTKGK